MKAVEITQGFKIYWAKVKLPPVHKHALITDVTIFAKNQYMARELLKHQYGKNSIISNVRELR